MMAILSSDFLLHDHRTYHVVKMPRMVTEGMGGDIFSAAPFGENIGIRSDNTGQEFKLIYTD